MLMPMLVLILHARIRAPIVMHMLKSILLFIPTLVPSAVPVGIANDQTSGNAKRKGRPQSAIRNQPCAGFWQTTQEERQRC